MTDQATAPRQIDIRISTIGGHEYRLNLREDAVHLRDLFTRFVNRPATGAVRAPEFIQLPLDGGNASCTIAVDQIVSIVTTPPVVIEVQQPAVEPNVIPDVPAVVAPPQIRRAHYTVIDDFLTVDEHRDMLALALSEKDSFEPGTVQGEPSPHRRNSVIMNFADSAHGTLLTSRLLVWFPLIAKALKEPLFPLKTVESQLTAANDGDYYKPHLDTDGKTPDFRVIACVYYFFREPKGFTGGDLRLYDSIETGGEICQADSFQDIRPASNRLVAFTCETFHELLATRCPSKDIEDSRFAVTAWFHRSGAPDPDAKFGWGHYRCGEVPEALR